MVDITLPKLPPGLTIEPLHEVAARLPRFLVRCNGRAFVVSDTTRALIEAVRDADGASWDGVYAHVSRSVTTVERCDFEAAALRALAPVVDAGNAGPAPRRTPFIVHAAVLGRTATRGVTSALTFMYSRGFAIPALLVFGVLAAFALPRVLFYSSFALTPVDLIELVAAVVASSLIHELGHAAAARRFGVEHGEIGVGVYLFYPMFYIDVDDLWRARPAQRVIVNLGGIYFQALALVPVLIALLFVADVPDFAYTFVWLTLLMMVQNLNPTFKLDGYWVLTDAAGLTNLHRRAFEALKAPRRFLDPLVPRVQRAALGAYFLLVAGYVAFIVFTIARVVETFGPIVVPYAQDAYDQIAVGFALHDGDLAQGGAGALVVGAVAAAVVIVPIVALLRRAVAARARRA